VCETREPDILGVVREIPCLCGLRNAVGLGLSNLSSLYVSSFYVSSLSLLLSLSLYLPRQLLPLPLDFSLPYCTRVSGVCWIHGPVNVWQLLNDQPLIDENTKSRAASSSRSDMHFGQSVLSPHTSISVFSVSDRCHASHSRGHFDVRMPLSVFGFCTLM